MSELELFIGPMMSGKSSELIRNLTVASYIYRVLYINHSNDIRSLKSVYSTHNPMIELKLEDVPFNCVATKNLSEIDIDKYDVIGIDEGQFFSNLKDTVLKWLELHNKIIYIASLDSDAKQQRFGETLDLIPHANVVHKLNSYCVKCKEEREKNSNHIISKAIYTIHKNREIEHEQVETGDSKEYMPVCRNHIS